MTDVSNIPTAHSIPANYGALSAERRPLGGYRLTHNLKKRDRKVKVDCSSNLPWVKYLKSTTNFTYSYIRGSFGSKLPLAKWQQNSICFSTEMREREGDIQNITRSLHLRTLHISNPSRCLYQSWAHSAGMLLIPASKYTNDQLVLLKEIYSHPFPTALQPPCYVGREALGILVNGIFPWLCACKISCKAVKWHCSTLLWHRSAGPRSKGRWSHPKPFH